MAVVNICRPAWKGPRVTRRTISLSLSLCFSPKIVPSFFTFREVSLNEFQSQRACFLSLSFRAQPSHEHCRKTNYSGTKNIADLRNSSRSNAVEFPNNGRGKREEDRTTTLENGASHAMDAYYARSVCFLSFFRPGNDRESFARCHRFRCTTAALNLRCRSTRSSVDEDVSMSCILGFLVCGRNERAFHDNAYMRAIENYSMTVLQLKDILCAFNRVAYTARVAVRHGSSPV